MKKYVERSLNNYLNYNILLLKLLRERSYIAPDLEKILRKLLPRSTLEESTIRNRMKKMAQEGFVQIVNIPSRKKAGRTTYSYQITEKGKERLELIDHINDKFDLYEEKETEPICQLQ